MKPSKKDLDKFDLSFSSSNQDISCFRIEGKDLIVEGSGLSTTGEYFTFIAEIASC